MNRLIVLLKARYLELAIALLCALVWIGLSFIPLMEEINWLVFDNLTVATADLRPLDDSIRLVSIDEPALNYFAEKRKWSWPWPHGAYAYMILYLKACGAKEIRFDIFFSTPDPDGSQDDLLRVTAQAAGNVTFAASPSSNGKPGFALFQPTFDDTLSDRIGVGRYDKQHRLLAWPPRFADSASRKGETGFIECQPIVARGFYMLRSLPEDALANLDPKAFAELVSRPPQLPPQKPSNSDAANFKDKIVYIGNVTTSGFDRHAFPLGSNEPGVMFQLTSRSNELQNKFFREVPSSIQICLIFLAALISGGLVIRFPSFYLDGLWTLVLAVLVGGSTYIAFRNEIWLRPVMIEGSLASAFGLGASYNFIKEGRKRRMVTDLFGKFVSKKMVQRLVNQPGAVTLGGEKAELTIMFSDLSGFTTLSEKMSSDRLVAMLNDYLNEMSQLIVNEEGTLDKYIGDAILAFWGAPDHNPNHAWQACHAAIECQRRLAELAPEWNKQFGANLYARIGLNTDVCTVGLIGSSQLYNYSVIGDAVNLASRLEGANKRFSTGIIIAQRTVDLAQGKIEVRPLALLQVKGKTLPVPVYELLAKTGELDATQKQIQTLSIEGYEFHLKQKWGEAQARFDDVLKLNPKDPVAHFYTEYIQELKEENLPENWNGVLKLDEK